MNNEIFQGENYKKVSELVEKNMGVLRQNQTFNHKYLRLTQAIDETEKILNEEQKQKLNEIITLFYETEEYYFALAYSLGIKYGQDLEKLKN